MKTINIPLQIYDFIAVLFPAILLMTFIQRHHPDIVVWQGAGQVGTITVLVVFAYIGGQLLATLSGMLERVKWLNKFFIIKNRPLNNQVVFQSRTTTVIMSRRKAAAVKQAFKNVYGYEMDVSSSENFGMIYSIVHDRMAKRDMFLALANYHLHHIVDDISESKHQRCTPHIAFIPLDIVLIFLFRQSYNKFKSFSDSIPFDSFLAWYKQQTLRKEQ